jgi:hypothetical protein
VCVQRQPRPEPITDGCGNSQAGPLDVCEDERFQAVLFRSERELDK